MVFFFAIFFLLSLAETISGLERLHDFCFAPTFYLEIKFVFLICFWLERLQDFQGFCFVLFFLLSELRLGFKEKPLWLEVSIPLHLGVTGVDRLHADGHPDLETESAQWWANSVIKLCFGGGGFKVNQQLT